MSERKRAPRREPDLDAVIRAAVDSLLRNGERGFRLEPIMEATGISRSSLYHHFGDRDGLIEAASVEIYFREVIDNMEWIVAGLEKAGSLAELKSEVSRLVRAIAAMPSDTRWNRLKILAACQHRPTLLRRLAEVQTEITDRYSMVLQSFVDRGWYRPGMQPREIASLMQGLTLARVVRDMDDDRLPDDEWVGMFENVLISMMVEG